MCINYVIPKIETRGEKKLSRKGNFARGRQPVARSPPSDRSLISMARLGASRAFGVLNSLGLYIGYLYSIP
jgi:hypothetical protein